VVVCDRYFDATMVYQGYARGVDKEMIRSLHRLACDDLHPDLTLLFDLEPEVGLQRAWRQIDSGGRVQTETRFEQEKLEFHRAVRDGYLDMARLAPDRFRVIAADRSPQEVARGIEAVLTSVLPPK
jgi:dTMP kinase